MDSIGEAADPLESYGTLELVLKIGDKRVDVHDGSIQYTTGVSEIVKRAHLKHSSRGYDC